MPTKNCRTIAIVVAAFEASCGALPMQEMIKPRAMPFIEPKKKMGISKGRFQLSLGPSRKYAKVAMMTIDIAVWNRAASVLPINMLIG